MRHSAPFVRSIRRSGFIPPFVPKSIARFMAHLMAGFVVASCISLPAAPRPLIPPAQSAPQKPDAPKTPPPPQPQSSAANAPLSLAEAAREARAQRAISPKASMVFTNDNLPTTGGISVVGPSGSAAASAAPDKNNEAATRAAKGADEAAWRQRFSDVRAKLRQDREAVEIMQRELGELNVQYYANPQQAMVQDYTRSDINSKTAAIAAKKQEIANLEQQLSIMEDELRQSGGDPGWARE